MRSCLVTQCRLAPRGNRAGTTNGALAFTTTVGVIVRVHYRTADGGTPAHVSSAAGLTVVHVLVIGIAYLTNGGHALYGYISQLTGGEPDQGVSAFLSHQLSHNASGTGQLRALAGVHLNVVDKGTNRNVQHGQSIAGLDVSAGAGHYGVTNRQAGGSDDVALLAVLVLDQRDVSGTVGIVLQGENGGGDTGLVSLEVDDAVLSAVSAASVGGR